MKRDILNNTDDVKRDGANVVRTEEEYSSIQLKVWSWEHRGCLPTEQVMIEPPTDFQLSLNIQISSSEISSSFVQENPMPFRFSQILSSFFC